MHPSRIASVAAALAVFAGAAFADGSSTPPPSVRKACMADVRKYCSGLGFGGGKTAKCMKAHADQLSDTCKAAVKQQDAQKSTGQGGSPSN
ncbi:MAG: cysteine rich repeat-containing protein [Caulobacterales bacterium]|jgi:hypothetical protein